MRAIAVSDIHLGWDKSQSKEFRQFLQNLPQIDYLLLLGDIFEMWRRDMVGVMIENRDVLDTLVELRQRGINVILIAGNHDEHLINMGPPENYEDPLRWRDEYRIQSGDRTYVFKHGHQYEASTSHDEINERLCHTNDYEGARMSQSYNKGFLLEPATFANPIQAARRPNRPYIPMRNFGVYRHVARPGLSDDYTNLVVVRYRARASIKPGEFLVHGHTHVALLEANYADTGTWTGGRRDYILIQDNDVQLLSW